MKQQPYKRTPHWIIINRTTYWIWGSSYKSLDEAEAEFKFSELQDKDWKIEQR